MDSGGRPRSQFNVNGACAARTNPREKLQRTVGRQRLSDITNTVSLGMAGSANLDEGSSKDCIVQLMKENSSLLKLLADKNKIMELSGIELQKHKLELEKSKQQNWQLAQANSHMLAELNLKKDRLKVLQHELSCVSLILKLKTLELEEKEKLTKDLQDKIGFEVGYRKAKSKEAEEMSTEVANDINTCNSNKKRKLKDQSLGSTFMGNKFTSDGKVDVRRRSMRTKSRDLNSQSCEVKKELNKASDAHNHHMVALEEKAEGKRNLKSESSKLMESIKVDEEKILVTHELLAEKKDDGSRKSLRRRSTYLNSESCESTENSNEREDGHLVFETKNKDLQQETTVQKDSSTCNISISGELEDKKLDSGDSSDVWDQDSRRSVGRPLRKAAKRVSSYRENNLKLKMRRPE